MFFGAADTRVIGWIEYSSLFTVAQAANTPQSLRQSLNSSLLQRRHKTQWERACPRWPQVRRSHPASSRLQKRHKTLWERACPRWPQVRRSHPASSRFRDDINPCGSGLARDGRTCAAAIPPVHVFRNATHPLLIPPARFPAAGTTGGELRMASTGSIIDGQTHPVGTAVKLGTVHGTTVLVVGGFADAE